MVGSASHRDASNGSQQPQPPPQRPQPLPQPPQPLPPLPTPPPTPELPPSGALQKSSSAGNGAKSPPLEESVPSENPSGGGRSSQQKAQQGHPSSGGAAQSESQPTAPLLSQPLLARALHGYIAETADELDFRKNDTLEILGGDLSQAWWFARRRRGGKTGFVPSNYVLLENADVENLPAWYEISRIEAELRLLQPGLPNGTFLLRPSSTGCYALSVRMTHRSKPNYYFVHHYKIAITANGRYSMKPGMTFVAVSDLLAHYHQHSDGLLCRLAEPCQRQPHPLPRDLTGLEVHRDCFQLEERIGNGSFCEVYRALWNGSVPVAVKMVKAGAMELRHFVQEAELLLAAHHPRVLRILAVCTTPPDPMHIVTELMPHGSLLAYLRKDNGVVLNTEHLVEMMIQLAEAMAHLESLRIVHRDLRADNILVGEVNQIRLADFGLARRLNADGLFINNEAVKFPAKWTPVEAALRTRFSVKSDVWSFGVVMWEIVSYGVAPYGGLLNREVLEFVDQGYRLPNPHGGRVYCDQNIYHIMLDCWNANPERRPGFGRIRDSLVAYLKVYKAATKP